MGNVTAPASVLAVGRPEYDPTGRLRGWNGSPSWVVGFAESADGVTANSWERLALAVGKASRQFMNIDEHGNEVPDDELGLTGDYTPNYVSDPHLSADGVSVQVDTKGFLTVPMGEALLRKLAEELGRLPFDTRVARNRADSPTVSWRPPHPERGEEPVPHGKSRTMVIARAVRCVVHNEVPDVTIEYFNSQDGWSTSRAEARVFEPDERGTHWETTKFALRLTQSMFEEA